MKKGRPQGPLRFGKRAGGPRGPLRFGKRSDALSQQIPMNYQLYTDYFRL